MKGAHACIVALSGLLLQACGQMPQTAEEFRKAVPGAEGLPKRYDAPGI
jgi:hypothetical protein